MTLISRSREIQRVTQHSIDDCIDRMHEYEQPTVDYDICGDRVYLSKRIVCFSIVKESEEEYVLVVILEKIHQ